MAKIIDEEPAKYPKNNIEEVNSVSKLYDLIDKTYFKPELSAFDKVPSTDGLITAVNKDQIYVGKLEIQIKTLPDENIDTPKYQCSLKFLAYCEASVLPVLLVVVNADHNVAYWLDINRTYLKNIASRIDGDSVVLHFPKENIINGSDTNYITGWLSIAQAHSKKVIDYDFIKERLLELEQVVDEFRKYPKPIHTIPEDDLRKIQKYISTYNSLLENEFSIIKLLFYKGFWKIGIAYSTFTEEALTFSLYPIREGENDLLIREVPKGEDLHLPGAISFVGHSLSNPIRENHDKYALSKLREMVLMTIQEKKIQLVTGQLAKECLYQYVDHVFAAFDIPLKKKYNLQTLLSRFKDFYPIWFEEYNNTRLQDGDILFDISFVYKATMFEPKPQAFATAIERYRNGDKSKLNVLLAPEFGTDNQYLIDSLDYLIRNDSDGLNRLYPAFDYSRVKKGNTGGISYFTWQLISSEDLVKRVSSVYSLLPKVIEEFVTEFFPKLHSQVLFFHGFDKLIININHDENAKKIEDGPSLEFYYLKSLQGCKPSVSVYLNGENCPVSWQKAIYPNSEVTIEDDIFRIKNVSWGAAHYIFNGRPLHELMYIVLKERFEQYFDERMENTE